MYPMWCACMYPTRPTAVTTPCLLLRHFVLNKSGSMAGSGESGGEGLRPSDSGREGFRSAAAVEVVKGVVLGSEQTFGCT
jgi:hypothetical protein